MKRREFLYTGVATAMAMNARSYERVLGANETIGLGIIGTGRRGREVGAAFLQDKRTRLNAIADVYDERLLRVLALLPPELPEPHTSVAYEELLGRKDVDAVYIAPPDHLHATIARAALEAGKHVYLEKPTLHRWSEHATLSEAAQKQSLVLQCGMQQRSGAHYIQAKHDFFDQKRLGDVIFVRAVWHNFPWQQRNIQPAPKPTGLDWDRFLGPAPHVSYESIRYDSWRYFPDYGNGLLADILTHWVDVAQWMLDDAHPKTALATGGIYHLHDGRQNPDTVSAIIQYENWNLNFESSVLSIRDDHPSVFFEGTNGLLDIARDGYTFTPHDGPSIRVDSTESLERAHSKNFLDAITQGARLNAPLQAGIEASVPVLLALQAYWSQRPASVLDAHPDVHIPKS
jgi:predicted dehydrogenase